MPTTCITGSTDGIGLEAARELLGRGHEVVVHARSEARGRPVVEELAALGPVRLVTGDLADLTQLPELADQIGAVDVLVHNAGVWVGEGAPRTPQGLEPTFAVNVLAPHVLTGLLRGSIGARLVFLGSGMVRSGAGRVDPERLGAETDPKRAYATSKALDVVLALAWARRLPALRVGAVDPGWVRTKLASPGATGEAREGGARVAHAAAAEGWTGGSTKGASAASVPDVLRAEELQEAVVAGLDALAAELA